ncbi:MULTISPECIES: CoA transferase [unclassified Cupriavidus]|uniref:CoA transferase n=1 Tax=unclassified Cupriavidus TaxID=2640874 RepID=UPI0009F72234|nr:MULTISPECIES: CoA transferase [unclassified Cupriavidus]
MRDEASASLAGSSPSSSPSTTTATPAATGASVAERVLRDFWLATGGSEADLARLRFTGTGAAPSAFAFTDFAAGAVGAASLALAELVASTSGRWPDVAVDRRLASFWFLTSLRPQGWALPPQWDPVAGDYQAADGWIRLHTNAPHHRDAALAVLEAPVEREAVARAVARWRVDELEAAVVGRGGCAAAMRSAAAWTAHPQGRAVAAEPLLHREAAGAVARPGWALAPERPLRGIRVLDLTRILAGPVATRWLAGFGAEVLRIDPPGWEEPGTVPEVVVGKRRARLDLKQAGDRACLEQLLRGADVLVHGYRPDALARLGLDAARRRELNPALVDVSLDAYGWSGPWQGRRGFDSLVQMSSGIAEAGMRVTGSARPVPLPGQALDHATGYLLAAAALRGLTRRLATGEGGSARASLARTAGLLLAHPAAPGAPLPGRPGTLAAEGADDLDAAIEHTSWGPAQRLRMPVTVAGTPMRWELPAGTLGSSAPEWVAR